jgi:hypothetical protein
MEDGLGDGGGEQVSGADAGAAVAMAPGARLKESAGVGEGPEMATRVGVSGSRKISHETFGRYPKLTTKHANQTP